MGGEHRGPLEFQSSLWYPQATLIIRDEFILYTLCSVVALAIWEAVPLVLLLKMLVMYKTT